MKIRSLRLIGWLALFGATGLATAQTPWTAGSDGSDLALDYSKEPAGIYVFSPATLPNPLAANHGSVYKFSTINIPAGITVKLSGQVLSGPQYWLSKGDVNIAGVVDLSGAAGYAPTNLISNRTPAIPGPGGFPGGVGGSGATGSPYPVENGQGPGAGVAACLTGGYTGNVQYAGGGQFTGNQFLVPLIGGSGGAGSDWGGTFGYGGGAGGGTLLIASDTTVTVNGSITAAGGDPGSFSDQNGGAGSGGAIRLAATTIAGTGTLTAASGNNNGLSDCRAASKGTVRLEAFNQQFAGTVAGTQYSGTPYLTFAPNGTEPLLTVVTVDGVSVAQNPTGSFTVPDVTFMSSQAVSVVLNGMNIPSGTPVSLQVYSENGNDIVMPNAGVLSGTSDPTSVTIPVNFPAGFSRAFISATFTSPSPSPQAKRAASAKPPEKLNAPK